VCTGVSSGWSSVMPPHRNGHVPFRSAYRSHPSAGYRGRSQQASLMPFIPKFSKETYDRLGHEVIDELVEWIDSLYDQKRDMADLQRTVREILDEVRALRLEVIRRCTGRP
jgi:MoxR-like ATPase